MNNILIELHAKRMNPVEVCYLTKDLLSLGEGIVERLVDNLSDPDHRVRSAAGRVLGYVNTFAEHGHDVASALPSLIKSLDDESSWVAFHAARTVWQICDVVGWDYAVSENDVIRRIAGFVSSDDPSLRLAAVERLGWTATPPTIAVPALIGALNDSDNEVRLAAGICLSYFGPQGIDALPALLAGIDSDHAVDRFGAAAAFLSIDWSYASLLAITMINGFEAMSGKCRVRAAHALGRGRFKEIAERTFPALERAFRSDDRDLQTAAFWSIGCFGPRVEAALPLLIEGLQVEDKEICHLAAMPLKHWGLRARTAIPKAIHIMEMLCDEPDGSSHRQNDLRKYILHDLAVYFAECGRHAEAAIPILQRAVAIDARVAKAAKEAIWKLSNVGGETKC